MNYPTTGAILQLQREKLKLSRGKLAKSLKFSEQFYGRIEKGAVAIPKRSLSRISKLLKIPARDLREVILLDYEFHLKRYL